MIDYQKLKKKIAYSQQEAREGTFEKLNYDKFIRKHISFDLSDLDTLLTVGKSIQPFGFKEFIENKCAESKKESLKKWGEKQLMKRGERHIRNLYSNSPERFSNVVLVSSNQSEFQFVRGNLIISEIRKTKRLSSHPVDHYDTEKQYVKEVFEQEKAKLFQEEAFLTDSMSERDKKLLGISA